MSFHILNLWILTCTAVKESLNRIHLCHTWCMKLTIFIKNIKNIKISSFHHDHVLCRFILKERIFVNFWYPCCIEQTSILWHIQWKSLQFNKAVGVIYVTKLDIRKTQVPTDFCRNNTHITNFQSELQMLAIKDKYFWGNWLQISLLFKDITHLYVYLKNILFYILSYPSNQEKDTTQKMFNFFLLLSVLHTSCTDNQLKSLMQAYIGISRQF